MSEESWSQSAANYCWRITNKSCEEVRYWVRLGSRSGKYSNLPTNRIDKTAMNSERFSIIWQVHIGFRVFGSDRIEKEHSDLSRVRHWGERREEGPKEWSRKLGSKSCWRRVGELWWANMKIEPEIDSEEVSHHITYEIWHITYWMSERSCLRKSWWMIWGRNKINRFEPWIQFQGDRK
jgi:hypothetical protein